MSDLTVFIVESLDTYSDEATWVLESVWLSETEADTAVTAYLEYDEKHPNPYSSRYGWDYHITPIVVGYLYMEDRHE
jgi:hypothetical protein